MRRTVSILAFAAILAAILAALFGAVALGGGGAGNGAGNGQASGIFIDLSPDHWAYEDVMYLVDRGIITGVPGGRYNGDQPLDRYNAAALIARAIRYLQNSPESVTPQDLDVLKDLIFKVSDDVARLEAQGPSTALAARVAQNEADIAELETQGVSAKLANRVNANFILSLTALLVGIIGVALATLGL